MTLPLLKPALYEPSDTAPALRGGRCTACGHVFFPMQHYGCERCGAHGDALQACTLSGRGTLVARATVHLHAKPERAAPFVIGTVRLADGPVVRTLLQADPQALPPVGTPVVTTWQAVTDAHGEAARDLRFAAA